MMKPFGTAHILMLVCTIIFYVLGCIIVRKSNRLIQNILFITIAVLCCLGIFFRYAMGLKFQFTNLRWDILMKEMLQVCNFNFILVILMLIPKNELARQYGMFFSMWAAITAHTSVARSFQTLPWYSTTVLNSWFNHMFAVALPLFMIASRRTKPKMKYVLPISASVFAYFSVVALISHFLIQAGVMIPENSFSFIYDRGQTAGFAFFYKLWPMDYFYLWLIFPFVVLFFCAQAFLFKRYRCDEVYYLIRNKDEK